MFRAAPIATGIESAMPTTVATTVIHRLSAMPSTISPQRPTKLGGKNAETNCAPRGIPCHTRVQLISVVPSASARYAAAPRPSVQRSQARRMKGGFFQRRGASAATVMASGQSCQAVAVRLMGFERDDVVRHVVRLLVVGLADGRRPVLLAVDLGQHIRLEAGGRPVIDDLA